MKMKMWWYRFRWFSVGSRFRARLGDALREVAVLWLVFAVLDKFVAGHLEASWVFGNITGCIACWLSGIYIEPDLGEHK